MTESSSTSTLSSTLAGSITATEPSPYYLNPSDNPGALITSVLLTGDNYSEWSTELLNSLQAKQKIGFIDGTIQKPLTNPDLGRWLAANSMIVGWIRTSIDPKVRSTVTYVPEASKLWETLKFRFSVKNGARMHQIQDEITNCRQDGQPVLHYYGRLSKLWEELQNLKTARLCTCEAAADFEKEKEDARVHKFLFGLDESRFLSIRSRITDEDPLPDMNTVYSRVIREEQNMITSRSKELKQDAIGFSVKTESSLESTAAAVSAPRSRDPSRSCTHCGRKGHEITECFLVHGYPEWWHEQQRQNATTTVTTSSNNSRGRGRGGRGGGRANTTRTVTPPNSEQIASLITLLQNQQSSLSSEKLSGKTKFNDVIIDTGASHHMTGNISLLIDIYDISPASVTFPDGTASRATKQGTLVLSPDYSLYAVLYVPNFTCTLISVSKLLKQTGCIAIFTDTLCLLQDRFSRTLIGAGEEHEGVYYFTDVTVGRANRTTADQVSTSILWHRRLGHPSYKVLASLPVFDSLKVDFSESSQCDICFRAKQTRKVFPESFNKATASFALIHCDVWGPYRTPSSCGAVYFLTIVDDFSRAVWTYLMLAKSEVPSLLQNFCTMSERQFEKQVKTVRSDNGTEFMALTSYFQKQGIEHQTSCVDTPQQNGRVERKHRHILNVARACLFQARLPISFWGESILAAAHIINRTPTPILYGKTPYEILHGSLPSYDLLRVFGCLCYAHRRARDKDKFGDRSRKCIFIGYPFGKKAWKLYDIENNEFFSSRDVVFFEDKFPGIESSTYVTPPVFQNNLPIDDWLLPSSPVRGSNRQHHAPSIEVTPGITETEPLSTTTLSTTTDSTLLTTTTAELTPNTTTTTTTTDPSSPTSLQPNTSADLSDPSPGLLEVLGRGHRQKKPSVLLKNFVTHTTARDTTPSHAQASSDLCSPTSVSGKTPYPIANYTSTSVFSEQHRSFLATITSALIPKTYQQAVLDPRFNQAMKSEVTALETNHTWDITKLPPGKKAIGCQWIYTIKYLSDGSIERYKARLVALGNRQKEGVEYTDTFAPVAKMTTVRFLLAVTSAQGWTVCQMDVHNAFLHGDLDEEIYMKLPPGFESDDPSNVCRLRKSLYGLKQAPRCWFSKLSQALKNFGFLQCYEDYSLFSLSHGNISLHILVYVDDFIIAGNDVSTNERFKHYLHQCFHMKDLGKLKYFLGLEIARGPDGIFVSQRKYALDIIAEAGLLGAKPCSVPTELNHKLALASGPLHTDPNSIDV